MVDPRTTVMVAPGVPIAPIVTYIGALWFERHGGSNQAAIREWT